MKYLLYLFASSFFVFGVLSIRGNPVFMTSFFTIGFIYLLGAIVIAAIQDLKETVERNKNIN